MRTGEVGSSGKISRACLYLETYRGEGARKKAGGGGGGGTEK